MLCLVLSCDVLYVADPVTGTKEEQEAVEAQAIGRAQYCGLLDSLFLLPSAHCFFCFWFCFCVCSRQGQTKKLQVIRFVMKDSLEEELYQRTVQSAAPVTETVRVQPAFVSLLLLRPYLLNRRPLVITRGHIISKSYSRRFCCSPKS